MDRISKQIIDHNFTKELKNLEYETKFDILKKNIDIAAVLKKIEANFKKEKRFLLFKIKKGDKLVTRVVFYIQNGIEYSYFKYRGARMLKVKKHKIIRNAGLDVFKNIESLLIDKKDFADKLARFRYRFRRHDYHLIDLEKKINNANATFSELSLFYKNGGSLVDILTKISRALPQGIYLTSINANPSLTQFSLTGFSKTREILLILKGNLEKETSFAEIYFPPENWVAPIDVNFVVNFKIK